MEVSIASAKRCSIKWRDEDCASHSEKLSRHSDFMTWKHHTSPLMDKSKLYMILSPGLVKLISPIRRSSCESSTMREMLYCSGKRVPVYCFWYSQTSISLLKFRSRILDWFPNAPLEQASLWYKIAHPLYREQLETHMRTCDLRYCRHPFPLASCIAHSIFPNVQGIRKLCATTKIKAELFRVDSSRFVVEEF